MSSSKKTACIFFPGMNCEVETIRVLKKFDLNPSIFMWNSDPKKLSDFDAFVLPGGFSFEDRSRAGVIASLEPALGILKKESKKGKPILGICNGAQIIVESKMLEYSIALAPNLQVEDNKIRSCGYFNEWVFIKDFAKKETPFNYLLAKNTLSMPIAHGEGRFVSRSKELIDKNTIFKYVDAKGEDNNNFPTNPNGSMNNCAAISNEEGNVCAMMPHPERSKDGYLIFDSLKKWLSKNKKFPSVSLESTEKEDLGIKPKKHRSFTLELFLSLKITDNEKLTIENALKKNGFKDLDLKRFTWWGVNFAGKDEKKFIKDLVYKSGIINTHRENIIIKIKDSFFKFKENSSEKTENISNGFLVLENENIEGRLAKSSLEKRDIKVDEISCGVFWQVLSGDKEKLVSSRVFSNPESFCVEL